jgi:hypothetical protein
MSQKQLRVVHEELTRILATEKLSVKIRKQLAELSNEVLEISQGWDSAQTAEQRNRQRSRARAILPGIWKFISSIFWDIYDGS